MTKKKRFGISEALTRGLSETINVVENHSGLYRNAVIPLTRIEIDPDNPRKLALDIKDIRDGIKTEDPLYIQKQTELEKMKELAHTIKTSGLINPIVVYKHGELYRIVAGERRYLSSVLIGKQDIEARIFNDKPRSFELKLVQWVENTAREDLTLHERLDNVRELIGEYQKRHPNQEMTASVLKNIVSLSLSQSSYYLAALHAPTDVQKNIVNGNIRNLDKAAFLAGINDSGIRQEAMEACIDGASMKDLRQLLARNKTLRKMKSQEIFERKTGRATKINMGSTQQTAIVKMIIDGVIKQYNLTKFNELFNNVNWQDLTDTSRAFKKFIEILEAEMAVK